MIGEKTVAPKVVKSLLGPFLKNYFESRALDVKESSQIVFSHTHKQLIEHLELIEKSRQSPLRMPGCFASGFQLPTGETRPL